MRVPKKEEPTMKESFTEGKITYAPQGTNGASGRGKSSTWWWASFREEVKKRRKE